MLDLNRALPDHLFQMVFVTSLLCQQPLVFERALHGRANLSQVERLGDVIERAGPHRLNRVIDGLLAADHDDHSVRRML